MDNWLCEPGKPKSRGLNSKKKSRGLNSKKKSRDSMLFSPT